MMAAAVATVAGQVATALLAVWYLCHTKVVRLTKGDFYFGVGFALFLPVYFGLEGVLYPMPIPDILTAVISDIAIAITYKQLSQNTIK